LDPGDRALVDLELQAVGGVGGQQAAGAGGGELDRAEAVGGGAAGQGDRALDGVARDHAGRGDAEALDRGAGAELHLAAGDLLARGGGRGERSEGAEAGDGGGTAHEGDGGEELGGGGGPETHVSVLRVLVAGPVPVLG